MSMEHNYPFSTYQMWISRVVMMVDCIGFALVWLVWDPHFRLSLVSFVAFYEVGDFDMDPRQEGVWGAIEVKKYNSGGSQVRVALHAGQGQA